MRNLILAGMGLATTVLLALPVCAQAPSVLILNFKADVLVDGSLANIEPDPSLAPVFQSMLRRRVAAWRYEPGNWQGKPVSGSISQQIEVEPEPLASGGFALRIKKVEAARPPVKAGASGDESRMGPPEYPVEARRNGAQGTFVYAMRVDPQGKPYDIRLVAPEHLDRLPRMLDVAARAAIAKWTMARDRTDGVPADCVTLVPIGFALGSRHHSEVADLAAPYRVRYADACPAPPKLRTEVAGTLL